MTSLPETLSEFLRASAATASASAADDECVADGGGGGRGRGIVNRFRLFQRRVRARRRVRPRVQWHERAPVSAR